LTRFLNANRQPLRSKTLWSGASDRRQIAMKRDLPIKVPSRMSAATCRQKSRAGAIVDAITPRSDAIHGTCKGHRMRLKTALAIVILSATPVLAQTVTNTRDANGNLPRDKGISANSNPTNGSSSSNSMQRLPQPGQPTNITRRGNDR
jgi:hypothetical protein